MSGEAKSPFVFEKLNNCNYAAWAFKMKMLLMKEDCWEPIEADAEGMSLPMQAKSKKAWSFIVLCVEDGQHIHVKNVS